MTAWRARLAALRSAHAGAESADSAGSKPRAAATGAIGANGPNGIRISGEREAGIAFLAEAAAGALATLAEREPDPIEDAEPAAAAVEGDLGMPPAGARRAWGGAGGLAGRRTGPPAELVRPPSWSDPASVPPPGAWCTYCGRTDQRGGRWWCEAGDAPHVWRCWTCHPPDHLPAEAVREVRT